MYIDLLFFSPLMASAACDFFSIISLAARFVNGGAQTVNFSTLH